MKKILDAIFPLIVIAAIAFALVSMGIFARLAWRLVCLGWGMA